MDISEVCASTAPRRAEVAEYLCASTCWNQRRLKLFSRVIQETTPGFNSRPRNQKAVVSVHKVLPLNERKSKASEFKHTDSTLVIFPNCAGNVDQEFIPRGQTVNQQYYREFLQSLYWESRPKTSAIMSEKWLTDSPVPAHTAVTMQQVLAFKEHGCIYPYSPLPRYDPILIFSCFENKIVLTRAPFSECPWTSESTVRHPTQNTPPPKKSSRGAYCFNVNNWPVAKTRNLTNFKGTNMASKREISYFIMDSVQELRIRSSIPTRVRHAQLDVLFHKTGRLYNDLHSCFTSARSPSRPRSSGRLYALRYVVVFLSSYKHNALITS